MQGAKSSGEYDVQLAIRGYQVVLFRSVVAPDTRSEFGFPNRIGYLELALNPGMASHNVHVLSHPVVRAKITTLRLAETSQRDFREVSRASFRDKQP